MPKKIDNLQDYFWTKATKTTNPNGCWEWKAAKNKDGYGLFGYNKKTCLTHRLSYFFIYGEVPEGKMVRHTCFNNSCINPKHLILGTRSDINQHLNEIKKNYFNQTTERICIKCKILQNVDQFYPNKKRLDGLRTSCKSCNKREIKIYRQNNIETLKEYTKKYYYENIESIKKKRLGYKEKISEYGKKYYEINKDKIVKKRFERRDLTSAKKRKYNSINKEIIAERNKNWRLKNHERIIAKNRNRRALKAGNGGYHTAAEVKYLKEIQDYKCLMCGKREPEIKLTFDHIVPISKGGGDGIGNCQMLCKSCNSSKNAKFIDLRGVKPKRKIA